MILEKFLIKAFAEEQIKPSYTVSVPEGALFQNKVKVLHDGIYAFFAVPELVSVGHEALHTFVLLQPKQPIPTNGELIDVLDIIYEMANPDNPAEPTQGMILLPIYKV